VGSPVRLTREHLAPHPFGGRLMSFCETLRRRVESPKRGNNWRPRPDTPALSRDYQMGRHAGNREGVGKPTLRGLLCFWQNDQAEARRVSVPHETKGTK
jgi:hypothetical protein